METKQASKQADMKKRILYFMPDNPAVGKAGNLTRSAKILDYLQERFSNLAVIEFLSVSDWGDWDEEGISAFNKRYPSITLTLINRKISKKKPIKRALFYKIRNLIPNIIRGVSVDITNPYFRNKVKKHLNKQHYDTAIMSYSSWGSLAFLFDIRPYLIIDTHDFLTAQSNNRKKIIGKLFQSEINILRRFDEIWTLSVEEKYIYEQFTSSKVVHHPITYDPKPLNKDTRHLYDIIYVASKNPHNIASIKWFIEKVSPLLKNYKIHIIGRICSEIDDNHTHIVKHGMVENIDEFYEHARIAICPMLSGTGVKIKVVEALANNLPIVTNSRGVDGLMNKTGNGCLVAEDANEFASHIIRLMEDDLFYHTIRSQAAQYFQNCHASSKEDQLFTSIFERMNTGSTDTEQLNKA